MYRGPYFKSHEEISPCINGKEIYADFDEFAKFDYPREGWLDLQLCDTNEIKQTYYFDGSIVRHRLDGSVLFRIYWANVKNLKFDGKLYSTSDDFDWNKIQRRIHRPSLAAPNGLNYLLCLDNSYSIPLDLSQFTEINSINSLDFGDYSMIKDYLIEQNSNSHSMSFYIRNPELQICKIWRFIENKNFPKFLNGEMEYDDDWGNPHLIEYGKMGKSSFYYEYVHNLDFGGEENLEVWSRILFSLYNDIDTHNKLFNCPPYIFRGTSNLHIGFHFGNMRIPGAFLDMLRERIIPIYKKHQIEEEERRLAEEMLEKRKKEEEERNKDYNLKNKHGKDAQITCDKNHFYLGSKKLIGTTKLISNFFPKFDADYWAGVKAPLVGKTKEQLLSEWERKGIESAKAGTILHERIDAYYHHKNITTEDKDYSLFEQFANAYNLNPYRSEWAIYDEDTNIVGVVDMLDYSNGEYILYDWKRSDKILDGGQPIKENKFDEFGLKPIENVPNTEYWHYALQLSFYRYILEKNYGIRVKESRLVVLHPSLNLPVVLTVPYMIDEVSKMIEVLKMN